MSESSESKIIQRFRESVDKGVFTEDMKVVYRVAGGLPSQRLEEEFILSGRGKAEVKALDMLKSERREAASADLNKAETLEAFKKIRLSLDSMVPRSEARFPPDSVVGSVSIEVGGEMITLYFPVEEVERAAEKKFISSPISDTIQYFKEISKRLLEKEKGGN